jgi:pimeloyl-ACP methyl ester carboxylesterase
MLADALGYDGSYNVCCTSYGTRLAQHALRTTPARVRAAIMDGTVSVSEPGNAHTSSKLQTQYDTIFELCAADAFCTERFPDLRARFIAVLAELSTNPLLLDPPIVGSDFFRNGGFAVVDRIDAMTEDEIAAVFDYANRPDTRLLLTSAKSLKKVLICRSYPHKPFAAWA